MYFARIFMTGLGEWMHNRYVDMYIDRRAILSAVPLFAVPHSTHFGLSCLPDGPYKIYEYDILQILIL